MDKEDKDGNLTEIVVESEESLSCKVKDGLHIKEDPIELAMRDRQHQIMVKFAKALWDVLKQYKKKLEVYLVVMPFSFNIFYQLNHDFIVFIEFCCG